MQTSALTLLALINDILDFSKIESGKLEVELIAFDLHELLHIIEKTYSHQAHLKQLTFECSVAKDVPKRVVSDPGRIQQITANLLSNAFKFTENGAVRLSVYANGTVDGATRVVFEVRDTGIGISKEVQDMIFSPFVQADGSTTRRFGGTGLGLAICRQLLHAMGGIIQFDSTLGEGSVFRFELPLRSPSDSMPSSDIAPTPDVSLANRAALLQGSVAKDSMHANNAGRAALETPVKILVAEDNLVNRKVILGLLKKLGYTADVAENGRIALEALQQSPYDLILMDLQMPEMDGFEAARQIREGTEGIDNEIPIIALTANAMKGDRELCLEAGMDDYLSKPIAPDALYNALKKWTKW